MQAGSSQRASDRACTRTDRKQCICPLLANRLISKEATEIFLRETTFTIADCPCWNSGGLLEDSLTKPRQALPNIHHLAVHGAIKAELGYLQYLLTSTSIRYRIAGKNGFPSKLKTLEIKGLVNLCILEYYISLRHSLAAKVSVRMLPLVSWLPLNPNGSLICVDIEALRVTTSVLRYTDPKAIRKDLTQISTLQNMVVVLNVCGEGSRDFW